MTYIPPSFSPTTLSPTSSETTTTDLIANVDRGMLGLNVTIGIAVAIVLLIIGAVVCTTVIVIVIIIRSRRKSANPCSTSDGKTSNNGTRIAVGNGVGESRINNIV